MRVAYRRQHPTPEGEIPDFLEDEFSSGSWERTGFDVDFPAIAKNTAVAAAVGYAGRNFLADSVDIIRWYNRQTKVIVGSVVFSGDCEGPPGAVHGGAIASALDDILGTVVWREAGFSRAGIPTMQLTVRYRSLTPMRRQLRFDTRVVKREGRKVFANAELRDPTSGRLLAEGEGLFYMREHPSPDPGSAGAVTGSSSDEARTKATDERAAQAKDGSPATDAGRDGGRRVGIPRATDTTILTYVDAIQEFGVGNPNAAENLVAFYGGDVGALRRARL